MFLGLWACNTATDKPKNLIEAPKMVRILTDIHLAESQISQHLKANDSSYLLYKGFEEKILKKYKISPSDYEQSYAYYLAHIEDFEKIYAQVVDTLTYREVIMNLGKAVGKSKKQKPSSSPLRPNLLMEDNNTLDKKNKKERFLKKLKTQELKQNP
ncbi:MAG: DUF4296 domain-containing protein [Thermonemataceae bacterium]|nr:DUF4296 domain-containing protein [Thermonemataceae bacterium]